MNYYQKIYDLITENFGVNDYSRGRVSNRSKNRKLGKDIGSGVVYGDELPKNLRHAGGKKLYGRRKSGPQDKGIGLHKNMLGQNDDRSRN